VLDVFCLDYGRVGLIARGLARRQPGGSLSALLQPFRPLLLSFSGRGELMTLTAAEIAGEESRLQGEALFSGFYLNELLLRVLHRHEANATLFGAYAEAIGGLGGGGDIEPILRRFEFVLLDELGYAVDLEHDALSGRALDPELDYRLDPQRGFVAAFAVGEGRGADYAGRDLIALARGDYAACGPAAKRLVRTLLRPHLGDAPLASRTMFATAAASDPQAVSSS
jgi:DNA repair protein RecO (recombination protein O)